MSYDLMVFIPEAAPQTLAAFQAWYHAQTEWTEGHTYDDPAITAPALRAWLLEMRQTFPDLNGDEATGDNDYETDYSIGRVVIYAAFSWSLATEALETALRLAQKHQVGLFDPSFEANTILLPADGTMHPLPAVPPPQAQKKPWWKVW